MKPISKLDQRLHGATTGLGTAVFGLPFAASGGYFVLVGLGIVEVARGVRAPLWVIGAIGATFAAAGLFLIAQGLRGHARRRAAARIGRDRPDERWLYEYPWEPGGVVDAPYRRAGVHAGFAAFLIVFLAPFNWWAFASGAGDFLVIGVVGLFDFIALALVASAGYLAIAALKYGRSQLGFDRFPFLAGERIEIHFSPNRGTPLETTLRFVEERMVTVKRQGKTQRHYKADALWSESGRFGPGDGRSPVPIRFELPDDETLVNVMHGSPSVRYWELVVEAHQPGVDFRTTFPLPVYASEAARAARRSVSPLPARRARGVRRIERHLAIAGAAVLALLVVLVPGLFADAGRALWRLVEAPLVIDAVDDVDPFTHDVSVGPGGEVWSLAQTGAFRIASDGSHDAEQVFAIPDEHQGMYLESMLVSQRGALWLGGWDGEVLHYDDGRLRVLANKDDGIDRAVETIVEFAGDAYVGANGVWRLRGGAGPPVRVEPIPARLTEAFASHGDRVLYAGVAQALWRLADGEWRQIWRIPRKHGTISTIALSGDTVLAGTYRGLFAIDETGTVLFKALAGHDVERILVDGERLWVVTGERGLLLGPRSGEGQWIGIDGSSGLPHEDLRGIAIDGAGRLWMAFLGGGVAVAKIEELVPLMTPR